MSTSPSAARPSDTRWSCALCGVGAVVGCEGYVGANTVTVGDDVGLKEDDDAVDSCGSVLPWASMSTIAVVVSRALAKSEQFTTVVDAINEQSTTFVAVM